MDPGIETEDEMMHREREETLKKDRRKQAEWYEKLNLFAESLRIYESIDDRDNVQRIKRKMNASYGTKASELESQGRYQEAANLYYLIGDHASVGRMKKIMPDLLIIYDSEGEGIRRLASNLDDRKVDSNIDHFMKPNPGSGEEIEEENPKGPGVVIGKKGVPVKIPKSKRKKFCPYCGEDIQTRKEPVFCPYCGEELA